MGKKLEKSSKTFTTVGTIAGARSGIFAEIVTASGNRVRVLERQVYDQATQSAGGELRNALARVRASGDAA